MNFVEKRTCGVGHSAMRRYEKSEFVRFSRGEMEKRLDLKCLILLSQVLE